MNCAWQELLNILPHWLKNPVDSYGRNDLTELRLRIGQPPELIKYQHQVFLERSVGEEDLRYVFSTATRYSPWTSQTLTEGYITSAGGHRIGICGEFSYQLGDIKNISPMSSLCIRIARNIPGVSQDAWKQNGSVLIIGPPGSGKTTFLRDLVQSVSNHKKTTVAVVDERREIFPLLAGEYLFPPGKCTDVLSGCKKGQGLDIALRVLGPALIAVDEITNEADCMSLSQAAWCGVNLIATAHAGSKEELYSRSVYKSIVECNLFDYLFVLNKEKKWHQEVMRI